MIGPKGSTGESIAAGDIDLLCVLGFAVDAQASGVTETEGVTVETSRPGFISVEEEQEFGRMKMRLVRMNVDLLMGEDGKKAVAGSPFHPVQRVGLGDLASGVQFRNGQKEWRLT